MRYVTLKTDHRKVSTKHTTLSKVDTIDFDIPSIISSGDILHMATSYVAVVMVPILWY